MTLEYFALYSSKCMRCSHLFELGTHAFVNCHHTKGNKQCPASEVKFVVVGKAIAYAKRVLKARDRRDSAKEAKLLQYVDKQSAAFKSKFYEALENPSL